MKQNKIIIFGSNGFVGSSLIAFLINNNYSNVIPIVRSKNSCSNIINLGQKFIVCDTTKKEDVFNIITNDSIVINCINGSRDVIEKSNEFITEACIANKAKKYIFLSSSDVYGLSSGLISEKSKYNPASNYGRSKVNAEKFIFKSSLTNFYILRPTIIFGPKSDLWTVRSVYRKINGFYLSNRCKKSKCNTLYIDDLCLSISKIIEKSEVQKIALNINGDDNITWYEFYRSLQSDLNNLNYINHFVAKFTILFQEPIRSVAKLILEKFRTIIQLAYQKNSMSNNVMNFAQSNLKKLPDYSEFSMITNNVSYDNELSKKVLDLEYTSYDKASERTNQWLEKMNLIQSQYLL